MDETIVPCKDLGDLKQEHLVKGNSDTYEIVDNDRVLKAEMEGPENLAEKETETESKLGCDVEGIPTEQDVRIRKDNFIVDKRMNQRSLTSDCSKQVGDSEEDHSQVDELELGTTYPMKNSDILEDVSYEDLITPKRSDNDPYISCQEKKSVIPVFNRLDAGIQPDEQARVPKSDAEGTNPTYSLLPSDDIDQYSNNDPNSTINPSENVEVIPEDNIEEVENDERGCANCSKTKRVRDASSLKSGQHLTAPGHYCQFYRHHFLLLRVVSCSGLIVELEVFHLTEIDGKRGIFKTIEKYDLDSADLHIIYYENPKYSPDKVIQRAESEFNDFNQGKAQMYNVIWNNCEHFVIWCMFGMRKSFQIQRLRILIENVFKLAFLWKVFCIIFSDKTMPGSTCARISIWIILNFLGWIIYCLYLTRGLYRQYCTDKAMCQSCLRMNLKELRLQLYCEMSSLLLIQLFFQGTFLLSTSPGSEAAELFVDLLLWGYWTLLGP